MSGVETFIRDIPKAELHVHLEGALQPETKLELARRNGLTLAEGSAEEIRASYDFTDLGSFLKCFNGGVATLLEEQDFYDLTWSYLSLVRNQNVLHADLHLDTQLHVGRGVGFEKFLKGVRRAQTDAERELDITSSLILAMYAELDGSSAEAMFEQSRPYAEWIAGIAFYPFGPDGWTPPERFAALADAARAAGHRVTAHCNNRQPQSLENLRQCVEVLDVDRIDHGVDIVDDEDLLETIRQRGLVFTVCPTQSLERPGPRFASELEQMLDRGLKVTVNSDDPAYFLDRYLGEILAVLQAKLGLSRQAIISLSRNALEAAWMPDERRRRCLGALDEFVASRA